MNKMKTIDDINLRFLEIHDQYMQKDSCKFDNNIHGNTVMAMILVKDTKSGTI